ncbi:hypothetical protein FG379_002176 [Cryptosporidium bovis]|uniref:uncharacterized protein n=1 Tax=Cryptosporidium bovis TaxID=310047 RepID=UPI00351AAC11|nr:hypothetical protein FG379_002176 [Cryptosporidium bovis]
MSGDVLLGYLEDTENKALLGSQFFPSKFGGKPAWLDPKYLPSHSDLQCNSCGFRLRFLLQIYAPLDERDDLFHRTLFVFICINCNQGAQVYRCQLPRKNDYYDFNPVKLDLSDDSSSEKFNELQRNINTFSDKMSSILCDLCGMPLIKETANYHDNCESNDSKRSEIVFPEYNLEIDICSTDEDESDYCEHEEEDDSDNNEQEQENIYMEFCPSNQTINRNSSYNDEDDIVSSFDRNEIVSNHTGSKNGIEVQNYNGPLNGKNKSEKIGDKTTHSEKYKHEGKLLEKIMMDNVDQNSNEYKLLKNYNEKLKESIDNVLDDSEMRAFKKLSVSNEKKDKLFDKFLSMSLKYKGHVIRYCYNGNPLWISERNKLSGSPPKCPNCNGERVFEFQVQPETIVLGNIKNNKVNFGILAIYTCSNNCKPSNISNSHYIQEYIYIQNNPY